jgi:hypothetical protein
MLSFYLSITLWLSTVLLLKFVLALGLYMDLVPNVGQSRRVEKDRCKEKDRELKPGVYSSVQDGFHGRSAQFPIQQKHWDHVAPASLGQ